MKYQTQNAMAIWGFVALAIVLMIFAPFVVIWALNILFGLGIVYTFWTWLAMLVVLGAFGKTSVSHKKS